MHFLSFLGAKEQLQERQIRWIPLWILLGITSDTLTQNTQRYRKPCWIHEHVLVWVFHEANIKIEFNGQEIYGGRCFWGTKRWGSRSRQASPGLGYRSDADERKVSRQKDSVEEPQTPAELENSWSRQDGKRRESHVRRQCLLWSTLPGGHRLSTPGGSRDERAGTHGSTHTPAVNVFNY